MSCGQIYIAYKATGISGGGNQFLKALEKQLERTGSRAEHPEDAQCILFNSFQFIEAVISLRLKYPDKVFLHRIDGPIRLYNHPGDSRDYIVNAANRALAHGTVFQSNWSRDQNHAMGLPVGCFETVIGNAADPDIFFPGNAPLRQGARKIRIISTSWSPNWKKGFDTYRWLDEHLDFDRFEFTFVGNSPIAFHNIKTVPPLDSVKLAGTLHQHDIYVTASQSDPCSNALIEALSCGLPAVALSDGGHPDILQRGGELFRRREEIPLLLERIAANYQQYQSRIEVVPLVNVARAYEAFAERIRVDLDQRKHTFKRFTLGELIRLRKTLIWCRFLGNLNGRVSKLFKNPRVAAREAN
jgi:glycosyltransferase involved in cell wall biosynthesis